MKAKAAKRAEGRHLTARIIASAVLTFGHAGTALLWLHADGPTGWIFAYCAALELLWLLLALERYRWRGARAAARRVRIGARALAGLLLIGGAGVIVIGLNVTPASAYLAWFQLVQEGVAGGTLAYMFSVKFAYFGALFSGLLLIGSASVALLNLAAIDLLLVAVLLSAPGLAAGSVVLFLTALAVIASRRNHHGGWATASPLIQATVVAALIALPISAAHLHNRLIDRLFQVRMEGMVAQLFPNFPFLYNVPGYGYSLSSSRIGDRPALTSRPVFEVTAPQGSTLYVRTGVYDTYTGSGWDLSTVARRTGERNIREYDQTATNPPAVTTDRITFTVLIDFYSSLPHLLGTVAFRFPGESLPTPSYASVGSGFLLEAPLRRGSTVVDLVAQPGQAPRPVEFGSLDGLASATQQETPPQAVPLPPIGTVASGVDATSSASQPPGETPHPPQEYFAFPLTAHSRPIAAGLPSPPESDRSRSDFIDGDEFFGGPRRDGLPGYGRLSREAATARRAIAEAAQTYGLDAGRYFLPSWERSADLETGELPERLVELARSLGRGRNETETIQAIESYLIENYTYSLITTSAGPYHDAVSNFLFHSKRGFCVQFASAFVILARLNGIPARYVTGFLAQLPPGATQMTVTGLSAHSWAEVWDPTEGWVTEEATPPMIAAAAGDPNVLRDYSPSTSGLTHRQLEAVLGGRLPAQAPTSSPAQQTLSRDLSRLHWSVPSLPELLLGALALLILAGLLRWTVRLLTPAESRLSHAVRQLSRRSRARGFPDPAERGWSAWSAELSERTPRRAPVARRAATVIHRSFFSGTGSTNGSLHRDTAFLSRLARSLPKQRRRGARAPRPSGRVGSRS